MTLRSEPRYALTLVCTITHVGLELTGETRNVSRGGMSLMVSDALPVGANVRLSLALNFGDDCYSEPLEMPAMIVWCTKLGEQYQIGAKFVQMTADHREFLQMFINYLEAGSMTEESTGARSRGRAR